MEQYEKDKEIERLNKNIARLEELLSTSEEQYASVEQIVERLREQLNEANDVIKLYATGTKQIKAKKYEGAFYITDPFTSEQRRIEDWGEEYDADVPISNDDKPAKAYLEKWGVK